MKVSQKIEKYIYSRLPACSAEVMSTRHIHWVFKHRNIRHTNVTLQMKKILLIKKYPKAFHIVSRTHYGGKPQQKFKELLSRGKKLTVARKKKLFKLQKQKWERSSISVYIPPYPNSSFWGAFCHVLQLSKCFTLQSTETSELEFQGQKGPEFFMSFTDSQRWEFGDDRGLQEMFSISHNQVQIKADQFGCATAATILSNNLHKYYFFKILRGF